MLTSQKSTETELRYVVKLELSLHEKMLVLAALRNHSDDRLKTAELFSDSGNSATYFADAGRLQLIGQKISQAITKWRSREDKTSLFQPLLFHKMFTLNDRRERELFEHYEQLAEFFEFDENAHNPIVCESDLIEDFDY